MRAPKVLSIQAAQEITTDLGRFSLYAGEGKGKSAAALGVALRSMGLGIAQRQNHKVALVRFLKGPERPYDEDLAIEALHSYYPHLIDMVRFGRSEFFGPEDILPVDHKEARRGWQVATGMILSGLYQVVVLDELSPLIDLGLLAVEEVIPILRERPSHVEIIVTGRGPHPALVEMAELFSIHTPRSGSKPIPGVHFTTGSGKGKSTSSLGQALKCVGRALDGADKRKIKIIQFLKGGKFGLYTEDAALAALREIAPDLMEHERYGREVIVFKRVPAGVDPAQGRQEVDYAFAQSGFWSALEAISSGEFQMVVMDEIFPTLDLDLIPNGASRLLAVLQAKRPDVLVHMTGRCWEGNPDSQELLQSCESHTHIEGQKHYYTCAPESRRVGVDC
ncbi:cob(I)yrinic acid a,c-diamide adenosyltransferase [Anthocerotibacter panamensis]|uniref:cob(I)yrinic acid a,c-diamide adenosyltransferase n=1 Tax=Anthocerotibacter panamensis TaxID=2857077 RepID=UPI001C4070A2|nr:cob(I)yrinic acid a,c-diamide adenosyltransferase [Anthocerotibacter panamensis]